MLFNCPNFFNTDKQTNKKQRADTRNIWLYEQQKLQEVDIRLIKSGKT